MQLGLTTEQWGVDDQSWIGSRHGLNNGRSVTLKTSSFTEATHYPDGFLKSGIPLVDEGDGTYGLWATGGTVAGFLLTWVPVKDPTKNIVAAMLDHGRVVSANLPVAVDAAGKASNPHIIFV